MSPSDKLKDGCSIGFGCTGQREFCGDTDIPGSGATHRDDLCGRDDSSMGMEVLTLVR